jgi:hypothetical protein
MQMRFNPADIQHKTMKTLDRAARSAMLPDNIRLVIKDQYNEIIPKFKDYNLILQITKRKQINIVHKFLEVICES